MHCPWTLHRLSGPRTTHGRPTDTPRTVHGLSMGRPTHSSWHPTDFSLTPWTAYGLPMVCSWTPHVLSMDTLRAPHTHLSDCPWIPHGLFMDCPRTAHEQTPHRLSWAPHGLSMNTLRTPQACLHYIPMDCSIHQESVGCPWIFREVFMDSPWSFRGLDSS